MFINISITYIYVFEQLIQNNLDLNSKKHDLVMESIKYNANILEEDNYWRTALALGGENGNKVLKHVDITNPNNMIKVFMQLIH